MNGNRMMSNQVPTVLWCVVCTLVVMGCVPSPSWQKQFTPLVIDQPQRERMLRDREAELAGLRADVANARIAAAKKEAEVQELREQVQRLRQELGVAYQQLAEERAETGKARGKVVTPLHEGASLDREHVASPPRLNIDTMLRNLTTEVEGLKRQLQTVQNAQKTVDETHARETTGLTGSARTPHVGPAPIQSLAIGFVGAATQSITVEAGDTLADVAERYHTSEAQLRQMNILDGDMLGPGQVLLVPSTERP